MLSIGNIARRDPNYRSRNKCKVVTDLSAKTTMINGKQETIYHDRKQAPYFQDLTLDPNLNKAAQFQAEHMARTKYVGHDGPAKFKGTPMKSLDDRLKHFKTGPTEGEGAGAGRVFDYPAGWAKSDTHFRPWFNVNARVTKVGLGAAKGSDNKWYFVVVSNKVN